MELEIASVLNTNTQQSKHLTPGILRHALHQAFLDFESFLFQAEPTPTPLSSNANCWAALIEIVQV
jgi:hypothetical protein